MGAVILYRKDNHFKGVNLPQTQPMQSPGILSRCRGLCYAARLDYTYPGCELLFDKTSIINRWQQHVFYEIDPIENCWLEI